MTEKEFRKLRSLDLIQILLAQSNEESRLREELDRQKEHLEGLRTHNEDLKTALNDKDALIEHLKLDLNQSDAMIHGLREELKALYTDKRINLENIGSLTEVAKRVNQIFEKAQREAEEYLAHPERVYAIEENECPENIVSEQGNPAAIENVESDQVIRNSESSVIDSVDADDIKVEVAIKKSETAGNTASDSVVFEILDRSGEAGVPDPDISENTDEVLAEDTSYDTAAESTDVTTDPVADSSADVAVDPMVAESTDTTENDPAAKRSADITIDPIAGESMDAADPATDSSADVAESVDVAVDQPGAISVGEADNSVQASDTTDGSAVALSTGAADDTAKETAVTEAADDTGKEPPVTEAAITETSVSSVKTAEHISSHKSSAQNTAAGTGRKGLFQKFMGGRKRGKDGK